MNSVEINSIRAKIYNELLSSESVDAETKESLKKEIDSIAATAYERQNSS